MKWLKFNAAKCQRDIDDMTKEERGHYLTQICRISIDGGVKRFPRDMPDYVKELFHQRDDGVWTLDWIEKQFDLYKKRLESASKGGKSTQAKAKSASSSASSISSSSASSDSSTEVEVEVDKNKSTCNTSTDDVVKPNKTASTGIQFDYKTGKYSKVTKRIFEQWESAYPDINLKLELKQSGQWLISNPTEKKDNMRGFINHWLKNAQEREATRLKDESKGKPHRDADIKDYLEGE